MLGVILICFCLVKNILHIWKALRNEFSVGFCNFLTKQLKIKCFGLLFLWGQFLSMIGFFITKALKS